MERIEAPIEVLGQRIFESGARLTKIKVGADVAYVRENVADGLQILELASPEDVWTRVAAIVVLEDHLKREVRHHPDFTIAWAEQMFAEDPSEHEVDPKFD